jgi:hypothetical protein
MLQGARAPEQFRRTNANRFKLENDDEHFAFRPHQEVGAKRLQIPRRYRAEVAQLLLKLGATPLMQSGVNVVVQRAGELATQE